MLRALGGILVLAALAVAGWEAWSWYGQEDAGSFRLASLGAWWASVHADSLQLIAPAIERHVPGGPWLYGNVVQPVLLWPLAVELFVLGLVLTVLGRIRL